MKETLKFRISSLENENSELQVSRLVGVVKIVVLLWAVTGWQL